MRTKKGTRESFHVLPGVQRVWGNEPSHSQVNSHVGSWSLRRTPESSEHNFRGQNSSSQSVLYIIEKLLNHKCQKWARGGHLNIWNTSYGQEKSRESNWQFDSRPLKVKNRPNFLAWRQRATYHSKALNKSYNFALHLVTIANFHKKLCALKVAGIPIVGISGLPLGSPGTKRPFGCGLVKRSIVYYKGEGGGFPQIGAVMSLVCPSCSWLVLAPKMLKLCTNHPVLVLCWSMWVSEFCHFFLVTYNFSLNLIAIGGLYAKLWAYKVVGVLAMRISGLHLGIPRQKAIWMWPLWRAAKYTIRGKVVASPKSEPWWVLCVRVAYGSSYHQKCSNYALTTPCWFVWIIEAC